MSQCLKLEDYLAGKILCGFSYGVLGHPVYTLEQRRKLVSDEVLEQVKRFAKQEPLVTSVNDNNHNVVHCEHCGHLACSSNTL